MMFTYILLPFVIILTVTHGDVWNRNGATVVTAWLPTITTLIQQQQKQPLLRLQRLIHERQRTLFYLSNTNNGNEDKEWSDFDDLGYSSNDPIIENERKSVDSSQKYIPQEDDIVDPKSISGIPPIDFAMLLQEKQQQEQNNIDRSNIQPFASSKGTLSVGTNLYIDYTAIQTRQFIVGKDIVLLDYVGTMGFQEVTDWEYYYNEDDDEDNNNNNNNSNVLSKNTAPPRRQVVQPNPFDSSKYVMFHFMRCESY
jgi:hypothetical protein